MPAFLFALISVVVASFGSHDQLLIARLTQSKAITAAKMIVASLIAIISALAMALSGQYISSLLPEPGKLMLVAFAMAAAVVELLWPVKSAALKEPTRSLGALALVLLVRQIGDASRFLIFAFAAATGTPWLAGIGGALGGVIAIWIGWLLADELITRVPLRKIRRIVALVVAGITIYLGLRARGIIG